MFRSTITIDLPSAEARRDGASFRAWVHELFGGSLGEDETIELLSVEATTLLGEIVSGFEAAGVSDVISLLVNGEVVYLDASERDDDLALMLEAAKSSGAFEAPFGEMHLALSHKGGGLHTIFDVKIVNAVRLGDAEMQIRLSSRAEALRPQRGERADAFAARIAGITADTARFRALIDAHDELTLRLGQQLREMISGGLVSVEYTRVKVIRPDARILATFPSLGFGDEVSEASYRPAPVERQRGGHDDPYLYFYHDPYFEFVCALLLQQALTSGAWREPEVHVIDPDGAQVCSSAEIEALGDALAILSSLSIGASVEVDTAVIEGVTPRPDPIARPWMTQGPAARRGFEIKDA